MVLKIVCLEEHVADPELSEAVRPAMAKAAPYAAGLGSLLEEDPSAGPQDRPRLQGPTTAERLAAEPVERRLRDMDEGRIDVQILSSTRAVQALPTDVAIGMAQRANDRLAATVKRHPGRFGAFALLPWQDARAAVREADRAVSRPEFVGALLAGRPGANALVDDPAYAPLLPKLEDLEAPLYIHPGPPFAAVQGAYYAGFNPEVAARFSLHGWGWHNEAGIQVIRLILSGTLADDR